VLALVENPEGVEKQNVLEVCEIVETAKLDRAAGPGRWREPPGANGFVGGEGGLMGAPGKGDHQMIAARTFADTHSETTTVPGSPE
jgi:hypothetical protein